MSTTEFGSTIIGRREGTPDEQRAVRADELRKRRIEVARRKWPALTPDQVDQVRFFRRDLVVQTNRGLRGAVYQRMTEAVWPSGDPQLGFNEDLVAAVLIDDDVTFLRHNTLGIGSVEQFEQMREDAAYLDRRRVERVQEQADRDEAGRRAFRQGQPLRQVTLADIERRELPTVQAAARLIVDNGGSLTVRDGNLRVGIPERLSPVEQEHDEIRERLLCAATVLFAAGNVVVPALESRSKKPLDERLPDAQVLAGGGIA